MSKTHFAFIFLKSEEDKRLITWRWGVLVAEVTALALPDVAPPDVRSGALIVRPAAFEQAGLPSPAKARAWVEAEGLAFLPEGATVSVKTMTIPGRKPGETKIAPFLIKDILGEDVAVEARVVVITAEVSA